MITKRKKIISNKMSLKTTAKFKMGEILMFSKVNKQCGKSRLERLMNVLTNLDKKTQLLLNKIKNFLKRLGF